VFLIEEWPDRFDGWRLRVAAAGSLGSRDVSERHCYNEIRVACEGTEFRRVTVTRWERFGDTYRATAALGPFIPGG
jgi:hypothetical protein